MSSLSEKLAATLKSRDQRLIRRRLPEPPSALLTEIDFTSNDYLSLSMSPTLRKSVLTALSASPQILGSGGSRLLVPSQPHVELESRLCRFFGAESALLFNSGFDANVGFFSAVPQPGDVVVYDAHIHASVHDGMRLSRLTPDALLSFSHNSVDDLRLTLANLLSHRQGLKHGNTNVFIAVETLYSMDGTIAPLTEIVECVEEMLPLGNGYIVVDEAHATGIYGPKGRGLVIDLGLENRVFARLHTFGKALASSGAVLLTSELVRDYLLNYARSIIYTTTLTFANIVAINCSFDALEDGTAEAWFPDLERQLTTRQSGLAARPWEQDPREEQSWTSSVRSGASRNKNTCSASRRSLPTPIIPVLTPEPRALSAFLRSYAASSAAASSVVAPDATTPSTSTNGPLAATQDVGTSRVRICLHAAHTREDVDLLVQGIVAWAEMRMEEERRNRKRWQTLARDVGVEIWMEAKL
ncbi:pyridoxal phosphate-dependent transferase [Chiua virens]|nr:pyridoxal phosphate-dependent transferase [Chiua virens]